MPGTIDNEALLGELRTLYARVDAHYADWTCPSSTECCRFGITGRQPYVTSIELALVERAIAKRGGMPSAKKRALPLTKDTPRERICPLLNRDNRCSIYSDRPFGCRTFFCDRATQGEGPSRAVLQGHVNELRDLAERHKLGGDAPRPLMRALTLASFALALIGTSAEAAPCFSKVPLVDELVAFQDSQGLTLCSSVTRECLVITDQGQVLSMRPPAQDLAAPKQTIVTASASPTVMVWRSTADSFQIDVPEAILCPTQFDWSARCDDSARAAFAVSGTRLVAITPGTTAASASFYDLGKAKRLWQLTLPTTKLSNSPDLVLADGWALFVGDRYGSAISFPMRDTTPSRDLIGLRPNNRDLKWVAIGDDTFGSLDRYGADLVTWNAARKASSTLPLPAGYPTFNGCVVNEFAHAHVFQSALQTYLVRSRTRSGSVGYAWDGRLFRVDAKAVTSLALACGVVPPT